MERKWMYGMNITEPEFVNGVQSFLIAAESNRVAKGDIEIFCPCSECKNFVPYNDIKVIEFHFLKCGFVRKYTCWSEHGESLVDNSTSSHLLLGRNEQFATWLKDKVLANMGQANLDKIVERLGEGPTFNPRWHVVMPGKRHILGVDNVVDKDEYNQFDELPPFSADIPPIDGDTKYIRSDHDEGLWVDTPGAKRRKKSDVCQLWDDTRHLTPLEIDQVAYMILNEFYRAVVTLLDTTAPQ
ncbi:ulp1 protease family, C-terminal catalytic domain-containing protein [Tanacetum coccineum]